MACISRRFTPFVPRGYAGRNLLIMLLNLASTEDNGQERNSTAAVVFNKTVKCGESLDQNEQTKHTGSDLISTSPQGRKNSGARPTGGLCLIETKKSPPPITGGRLPFCFRRRRLFTGQGRQAKLTNFRRLNPNPYCTTISKRTRMFFFAARDLISSGFAS
jgi:hypothetical protein